MAPTKSLKPTIVPNITARRTVTTRSKVNFVTQVAKDIRSKRKADGSPTKDTNHKRSAFGDITNALTKKKANDKTKCLVTKKVTVQCKVLPSIKTVVKSRHNDNLPPPAAPQGKIATRASTRNEENATIQKVKEAVKKNESRVKTRLSNEFEKTEESLYSSALENLNLSSLSDNEKQKLLSFEKAAEKSDNLNKQIVPNGVIDFDKENWNDIFQASHYAMDIFNYYKSREPIFAVRDYMDRQVSLSRWMRALLVDWMVEVQESFELNHETLYLGVKLVDLYLSKATVAKDALQLVGAASMFIASKYDERIPPLIDDFLYICDGAYTRRDLTRMEISVLKICDYDLGIPISYRFLRRYARCAKLTMPVLTLARYILEYSLMDYATITIRDSVLASAALYLALRMKNVGGWTPTLEFYTSYKLDQILHVVHILNNWMARKLNPQITTIKNKYSHKIFFEVAKVSLLTNEELCLS